MKKLFLLTIVVAFVTFGCGESPKEKKSESSAKASAKATVNKSDVSKTDAYFKRLPGAVERSGNQLTYNKVRLGKKLYSDVQLSKDRNVSCNSCHDLKAYGVDNLPVSPGDEGKNGTRNSPTVYNAALHFVQFWDGREPTVETQAGGPILNPVEMNIPNEKFLVDRLKLDGDYQVLFAEAYPNDDDPITFHNITYAIAAFERKLFTPGKFDRYIHGKADALTKEEIKGMETFVKVGCTTCHSGALLGGTMYQKFGLFDDYWKYTNSKDIDEGRMDVTNNEADKYVFKVPSLRNIEKTYPYFHDGSVNDLGEAVKIMAKLELNKDLTDKDVNEIITFLKALTGPLPKIAK